MNWVLYRDLEKGLGFMSSLMASVPGLGYRVSGSGAQIFGLLFLKLVYEAAVGSMAGLSRYTGDCISGVVFWGCK